MILWKLFLSFLKIGFFVFGGGYAMLPMIQDEVLSHGWLNMDQYMEGLVLGNSLPGPLAVNMSTYVGYKTAGIPGGIVSTVALCLPALVLTMIGAAFITKYKSNPLVLKIMRSLQPAVVALIAVALFSVAKYATTWNVKTILLAAISFLVIVFLKVNPIYVIIGCAVLGYILL
jgi:chromate transporter